MEDAELISALDNATTWSAYCENQLAAAVTLTNAQQHPERVLHCINQALFAASQVVASCSVFKGLSDSPPLPPGESRLAGVMLDLAYCRKCNMQQLGDQPATGDCSKGGQHDWTREVPR